MHYALTVSIEPGRHALRVDGVTTGLTLEPGPLKFFLNEEFTITRMEDENGPVSWSWDTLGQRPPFDTVSRPVRCQVTGDALYFAYHGQIPKIINNINQIDEGLVELASYAGWYPKGMGEPFTFAVTLELAPEYRVASNGAVRTGVPRRIESEVPQTDIVLFASSAVVEAWIEDHELAMGAFCPPAMLERIPSIYRDTKLAVAFFSERYGPLEWGTKPCMTSVWRPRGGWGYRRGTASFLPYEWVSEDWAEEAHELAHSWWGIADVTRYDWINEGGAEFSAYAFCRQRYGEGYAQKRLEDYWAQVQDAGSRFSIADTTTKCPDRYVNHYVKTTLMLLEAQKRFGDEAIFRLLRGLYQRHKGTRDATEASFLELARELVCQEAADYFLRTLHARQWRRAKGAGAVC